MVLIHGWLFSALHFHFYYMNIRLLNYYDRLQLLQVRILRTSGSDKVAGVFRSKKKKVARVSLVFKILEASIKQEDFGEYFRFYLAFHL